jgi:hypothetical protein
VTVPEGHEPVASYHVLVTVAEGLSRDDYERLRRVVNERITSEVRLAINRISRQTCREVRVRVVAS